MSNPTPLMSYNEALGHDWTLRCTILASLGGSAGRDEHQATSPRWPRGSGITFVPNGGAHSGCCSYAITGAVGDGGAQAQILAVLDESMIRAAIAVIPVAVGTSICLARMGDLKSACFARRTCASHRCMAYSRSRRIF
jgi:hypothetical protein